MHAWIESHREELLSRVDDRPWPDPQKGATMVRTILTALHMPHRRPFKDEKPSFELSEDLNQEATEFLLRFRTLSLENQKLALKLLRTLQEYEGGSKSTLPRATRDQSRTDRHKGRARHARDDRPIEQ